MIHACASLLVRMLPLQAHSIISAFPTAKTNRMKGFINKNIYFVKKYHLLAALLLIYWMINSLSEHFFLPAHAQIYGHLLNLVQKFLHL